MFGMLLLGEESSRTGMPRNRQVQVCTRRSPAEQHGASYVIRQPERTTRLSGQFYLP